MDVNAFGLAAGRKHAKGGTVEMWSAAQVHPNQSHIAIRNLDRQGFTAFHPTFEVKRRQRNKLVAVQEALFPGYLFIEILPAQRWAPIASTWGVSRLLTRRSIRSEYREPCVIPEAFICDLRGCCRYHIDGNQPVWRLALGTRVTIRTGPFAGFEGTIASWSGADPCRLIVWLLNRETTVTVYDADIAAVE
jgi:transcriptional antiterminator RfaH